MKRPLSVVIITKHPDTMQEIHRRFDTTTSYPRLKMISILLKVLFKVKL